MDCSPPGSSFYGIFQARVLEYFAISFSRGSSWPKHWMCSPPPSPEMAGGCFTTEPLGLSLLCLVTHLCLTLWDPMNCSPPGFFVTVVEWVAMPSSRTRVDSVQFSLSVVSDSLQPHGLQHPRLLCLSPTPRACSKSCQSNWWCHPTILSSVIPFSSCLQSFPASGSYYEEQMII